ncbi:MAG: hypothetical protein LBB72_03890 [Spirochaetaceae bacterium]|jgi:hypothetical protein|nr:hypothetical protein [Spirochaetaceae bacterium]
MRKSVKVQYKPFFAILLFLVLLTPLFARGKKEEQKNELQFTEFVLCITTFDVSALPLGQQALGPILQREFVRDLMQIHHRLRSDGELLRYEEAAWTAAKRKAAAKLAAKRGERDTLLFRGYPNWKYKKELKRINKELKTLEEEYQKALEQEPIIEESPLFKLIAANTAASPSFPQPPAAGREESFLRSNNADAFLSGKFRLLYGRIYAEFRIFTRASSFIYEDSLIFSSEDLSRAANEIKQRFLAALINTDLIRLVLYSDPEDAWIEINGRFIKSGETLELPPGPVTIKINADEHYGITKEMELEGGKQEFAFTLMPFTQETLDVAFSGPNSALYLGALLLIKNPPAPVQEEVVETADEEVMEEQDEQEETEAIIAEQEGSAKQEAAMEATAINGETAIAEQEQEEEAEIAESTSAGFFSVYIPAGQYRYIRVDTENGLTGEAIVKGSDSTGGGPRFITLKLRKLPGKDDKPVENARKKFYGAYGRFWVALPLTLFISGVSQSYANSYNVSGNPDVYDKAVVSNYVSIGAWVATGVFIAESVIRLGIYIHTASRESIPYKDK